MGVILNPKWPLMCVYKCLCECCSHCKPNSVINNRFLGFYSLILDYNRLIQSQSHLRFRLSSGEGEFASNFQEVWPMAIGPIRWPTQTHRAMENMPACGCGSFKERSYLIMLCKDFWQFCKENKNVPCLQPLEQHYNSCSSVGVVLTSPLLCCRVEFIACLSVWMCFS